MFVTGVSLGGSCAMNASCIANVSNSECKNTTCQCAPKYYQDNNTCQSSEYLKYFILFNKNNKTSHSTLHIATRHRYLYLQIRLPRIN